MGLCKNTCQLAAALSFAFFSGIVSAQVEIVEKTDSLGWAWQAKDGTTAKADIECKYYNWESPSLRNSQSLFPSYKCSDPYFTVKFEASAKDRVIVDLGFTVNGVPYQAYTSKKPKNNLGAYEIQAPLLDTKDVSIKVTTIEESAINNKNMLKARSNLKTVEREYLFLDLNNGLTAFSQELDQRIARRAAEKKEKLVKDLIIFLSALLIFITFSFFLIRWLIRRTKHTVKTVSEKTKDYRRRSFIKEEVEKEIIRQTIRDSMQQNAKGSVSTLDEETQ